MFSLPVVVVILTIVINIVSTIGATAINQVLWNFYTRFIPSPISKTAASHAQLRRSVLELRRELSVTSSQDQFAKWAKVRRTLDKKVLELESLSSKLQSARSGFDTKATTLRWAMTAGLRILLQLWYSRTPIFWIPTGWVPSYVEWLLAFPRAPRGSVSIQVWSFAASQTMCVILAIAEAVKLWACAWMPVRDSVPVEMKLMPSRGDGS